VSKSFHHYNILKRSTISLKEKSFRLSIHFYIDLPATIRTAMVFLTLGVSLKSRKTWVIRARETPRCRARAAGKTWHL
jgi:hypothetical protein